MRLNADVNVSGPLFTIGPRELTNAIKDTVEEVVLTGEREARLMAQPAPSGMFHTREYAAGAGYFQTGNYNRSINGRLQGSLHGTISDSNSVYGPWLEGVSSRNQATRFRGYHIFRKTKEKLDELLGSILDRNIIAATRRLS